MKTKITTGIMLAVIALQAFAFRGAYAIHKRDQAKAKAAFDFGVVSGIDFGVQLYKEAIESGKGIDHPVEKIFERIKSKYPEAWRFYNE